MLYSGLLYNEFLDLEPPHRLVQSDPPSVQVGVSAVDVYSGPAGSAFAISSTGKERRYGKGACFLVLRVLAAHTNFTAVEIDVGPLPPE